MSFKKQNSSTQLWDRNRNKIVSRKGGWKVGQGVFSHGHSLMDDLVGEVSYFQVMIMNVIGHLPERRLADWLEATFICMSWPDPRIWCNQIGALAGTARTKVVGATTAGVLAADSTMYGSRPLIDGAEFIQGALLKYRSGDSAEKIVENEIAKHRGKVNITGFARPLAKGDERVVAMERVTKTLGFEHGPHLTLAMTIDRYLQAQYGESININGYGSAFFSDQGYSAEDIYKISALCVMSGVTACYLEEVGKPVNSFLSLKCEDVEYKGRAERALL